MSITYRLCLLILGRGPLEPVGTPSSDRECVDSIVIGAILRLLPPAPLASLLVTTLWLV